MSKSIEATAQDMVGTPEDVDRPTQWLAWATAGVVLMLIALVAYAYLAGVFVKDTPARTAEEDALAQTSASIAQNPSNGAGYAVRAEALFAIGDETGAFATLDTGEAAVKGKNPDLLYVLRSRTALLDRQGKFAEAAVAGEKAMKASDDYLKAQGVVLVQKGINVVGGNTQTRPSVDTALQVAEAYMGLKNYDKAIGLYNYALALEPTAADIVTMRGWVYIQQGDKVKAKADFERALEFMPDDADALSGMKQVSD
jgi:tetratricopeptide (TPR) repeat protein